MKRKQVGFVTVDDGRINISDGGGERLNQWPDLRWQPGRVIVGGFGGDGHFPVFVETDGGQVSRIVIEIDGEARKDGDA